MNNNWYIVLGLEFDPPIEDEQVIAEKINEKEKLWVNKFNDFKMGSQYRAWHQKLPQIRKDMIGSYNIRKQLATQACELVYEPIDALIKSVGEKGCVYIDEGNKISKKFQVSLEVVRKRVAKLGIKWDKTNSPIYYQEIYDRYYKIQSQNSSLYEPMQEKLLTFNSNNSC